MEGNPYGQLTTPLVVAAAYAMLFALERMRPLRKSRRGLGGRLTTNAIMTTLTFLTGAALVRGFALGAAQLSVSSDIGLLRWIPLPTPLRLVAGFLLMDFSFYWWHRANHEIGILWRFHSAHHVDPDLDVTTGFRFHPVEIAYSAPFRVLQVLIIGVSPLLYVTYELFFQLATLFHHSNLHLPIWLERGLNKVVVTPRMHGIHHSQVRKETDSNYSTIFRWWDYLQKTLYLCVPQSWINIGVSGYDSPEANRTDAVLLMPFRRQKAPDKKGVKRREEPTSDPTSLAE